MRRLRRDDDVATAPTNAAGATTSTSAASAGGKHPCDLLSLADVNRITKVTFEKTERTDPTPSSTFNASSCKYVLNKGPGGLAERATVILSISRASGSRSLDQTGGGSFLSSTKVSGKDRTIPGGVTGATDTGFSSGTNYSQAAARFADDRIVYVSFEANSAVAKNGYTTVGKEIELLKEATAKGA